MYFVHQYKKYVWEECNQTFIKIEGFDSNVTIQYIHDLATRGLTREKEIDHQTLYGENVIHVEVPAYITLLLSEVLNPFYMFQLFACIFWMFDDYYAYATSILIISTISAIVSLITVRRERQNLHDMVERHNTGRVTVLRQAPRSGDVSGCSSLDSVAVETFEDDIWSRDLVPGDVVLIPPTGLHLSFDAALISGTCIVNESMLTGESVPVTKTPLASSESEMRNVYAVDLQKPHTLFCGTEVIQTRYYSGECVKAVVVRTGFGTAKGDLVHSILFPKPVDLKLLQDAYRFVFIMFCISLIGFAYSCYIAIKNQDSARDIFFKSVDVITITVPPALPLAMTIGLIYAQARLKKAKINTVSPQRINICGQIDVVSFDKTGTLTEDGLDLTDIVQTSENKFAVPLPAVNVETLDPKSHFVRCMTTCHSLTIINGEVSGDPLDVRMFQATGWSLVEPKVGDESKFDQIQTTYVSPPVLEIDAMTLSDEFLGAGTSRRQNSASDSELGIIRQFPFLSDLQRASVIVKPLRSEPNDMVAYVKGAPEKIASLCLTVPSDFTSFLSSYTQQGQRVIALAYKPISLSWRKAQKIERDSIEKDLNFLGFLLLQNKLKATSASVIQDLETARIRTVMVTGDNLETAMSVAYECKILKPNIPVLTAKTNEPIEGDQSSQEITLTWHLVDNSKSAHGDGLGKGKYSPLSSSDECERLDSAVSMGDSISPFQCQLALTGKEFSVIRKHYPEFVPAVTVQGTVFARMSPQQKTELMEELDAVDYHVLMCGDGANDCGALKRAHVGLSLSEYEASVAAPFTSHTENGVGAVVTLMREGRAALVTSFGMFKFMALYSMIQFTTVLLLYRSGSNMSDYEFLYIDLIIIDVVALTMSRNHAHKKLHWTKPAASLVSLAMLVSLFSQISIQFGIQIGVYISIFDQCWYSASEVTESSSIEQSNVSTSIPIDATPTSIDYSHCPSLANVLHYDFTEDDYPKTYESTTLFLLSSFMYMSVSVAFSRGKPFRTSFYKNIWFIVSLLVLTGFTLFLMFGAPPPLEDFMEMRHIPSLTFSLVLAGVALGHFLLALLIELVMTENSSFFDFLRRVCGSCCRKGQGKLYKYISEILSGKVSTDGTYATIPVRTTDGKGGKRELKTQRTVYIPSQTVGQPMHPKKERQSHEQTEINIENKTRL